MVISERRIAVSKEMEGRVEASRGLLGAVKLKGTTGATSKLELTLTTSRGGGVYGCNSSPRYPKSQLFKAL